MTKIDVFESSLSIKSQGQVTSGSENYFKIQFSFDKTWEGYIKYAVFYQSLKEPKIEVEIDETTLTAEIPNEMLVENLPLFVGVYGIKDEAILSTDFAKISTRYGAFSGNIVSHSNVSAALVRSVNTKIKLIRENENGEFEYSTDGENWKIVSSSSTNGDVNYNAILERVAQLEKNLSTTNTALKQETTNRTNSDTQLTNRISTEEKARKSEISRVETAINNETDNRETAVSSLRSEIYGAGYITKVVDDLINYYKKSELYTKEEINSIISGLQGGGLTLEKVNSLPSTGNNKVIYLVPVTGSTNNVFEEYIWVNSKWELIGSTAINLANYYTKQQIESILSEYLKKTAVDSAISETSTNPVQNKAVAKALNSKANTSSLSKVATSGSYNDLTNKPNLFSGDYKDLTNKPTLFSGSYNDLTDKPTIPTAPTIDTALSTTSENPVRNKVVTEELGKKVQSPEKEPIKEPVKAGDLITKLLFDTTQDISNLFAVLSPEGTPLLTDVNGAMSLVGAALEVDNGVVYVLLFPILGGLGLTGSQMGCIYISPNATDEIMSEMGVTKTGWQIENGFEVDFATAGDGVLASAVPFQIQEINPLVTFISSDASSSSGILMRQDGENRWAPPNEITNKVVEQIDARLPKIITFENYNEGVYDFTVDMADREEDYRTLLYNKNAVIHLTKSLSEGYILTHQSYTTDTGWICDRYSCIKDGYSYTADPSDKKITFSRTEILSAPYSAPVGSVPTKTADGIEWKEVEGGGGGLTVIEKTFTATDNADEYVATFTEEEFAQLGVNTLISAAGSSDMPIIVRYIGGNEFIKMYGLSGAEILTILSPSMSPTDNGSLIRDELPIIGGDNTFTGSNDFIGGLYKNGVEVATLDDVANAGGGGGGSVTVDSELSATSENPVQNKVVTEKLNELSDSIGDMIVYTYMLPEATIVSPNIVSVDNDGIYMKVEYYSTGLAYTLKDDNTYEVSGIGTCSDTDVIIPLKIQGLPVTSIGNSAFNNCKSLTSIAIPDGVTTIGAEAFFGCNKIKAVYYTGSVDDWCLINFIYADSNPLYYGADLYINRILLTEATINSSKINDMTFYNCKSLTSIVIGDNVTSIGNNVFYGCSSLTSVVIGSGVTSIDNYAFWNCSNLINVTIGNSVASIGESAFNDCSSLTSIIIPDSVTSIGSSAFSDCNSLTNAIFNNPNGWEVSKLSEFSQGEGTAVTLSDISQNAIYLNSTHSSKYWKRF